MTLATIRDSAARNKMMNKLTDKAADALLCAGICLIWYSITMVVGTPPLRSFLTAHGMLMPALCLLELVVLVPLYCRYRQRCGIAWGTFSLRPWLIFSLLLLGLIYSQSFWLLQEGWTASQLGGETQVSAWRVAGFSLAVVVLAPLVEEIVFRGFLLQALLIAVPGQRLACALLTSFIFAALHTQYTHLQTLFALAALSLLLCFARFYGGLKLSVTLHMLNNFIGVAPWLWITFVH